MMIKRHPTMSVFFLLLGVGVALSYLFQHAPEHRVSDVRLTSVAYANGVGQKRLEQVVCMVPSAAETVFALKCGERVAGLSNFCTYPPEALSKPKLGGFFNPNFERLMAMQPDLVITQGKSETLTTFCHNENIHLLSIDMYNIEGILNDIRTIGKVLAVDGEAEQLIGRIQWQLDSVRRTVRGLDRPSVFFCMFRMGDSLSGVSSTGGKTYLSDLIRIAGGENVFGDVDDDYPKISRESLLKREPEIIIETYSGSEISDEDLRMRRESWNVYDMLPAVKHNRIYFLSEEEILKPGPRIGQMALILGQMIHPEVFNGQ